MTDARLAQLLATATRNGWTLTRFARWAGLPAATISARVLAFHAA